MLLQNQPTSDTLRLLPPSSIGQTLRYYKLEIICRFGPCHLPSDLDFSSSARTLSVAAPVSAMPPPFKMWSQKINQLNLEPLPCGPPQATAVNLNSEVDVDLSEAR